MHILADENIPLVEAFFGGLGEIRRLPGRAIDRAALASCDVLLVRSVTRVDRELLEGTPVKFVGTCTIGTDHLDAAWLEAAGIRWASAPGCNARGVVDYVLSSWLALAEQTGIELSTRRFGVVGAGQVGGRLVEVLRGLGWDPLVCDPPRQRREGGAFVSLTRILEECDAISLHTPLITSGEDATFHLLNDERLGSLRPGAWLVNASRGAVVDNDALRALLRARQDVQVVLDVWEGEPQVDVELARLCRIATPHIAGYSLEGKLRGTAQIYEALCDAHGWQPSVSLASLMPDRGLSRLVFSPRTTSAELLGTLCRAVYDPRRDDAAFRRGLQGGAAQRRSAFDLLRKEYPERREIEGLPVTVVGGQPSLEQIVRALGAQLV